MKSIYSLFLIVVLSLSACNSPQQQSASPEPLTANFEHDIESGPTPWNGDEFEETEEDFTFAFISDLTGGERPGIFSVAVEQINRIEPTFVVSVGDLINGGTEDSLQLKKEWDSFDHRANKLDMPFFYLGGNHDLTNPIMREFWKNRFGPRYYHFVYENVLFLMIDSEDFEEKRMMEIYTARAKALKIIYGEIEGEYENSEYYHMLERRTGAMSDAQLEYYKNVLNKYPDVKWTFVIMHKPMWTREDEKGLGRLEAELEDRSYTVINGHEHSFSHRIRKGMDYIMLGTTGGGQFKDDPNGFDHITLVRMAKEKPVITHIRMDGILDETGKIPLGGDSLNFQASKPN
ncbi:MAG: hypothetical protein DRI71_12295 [Bacteroidetes bacterium]|nr:MAG: hypothetical protein DRI71_12295 [Bacteroidota bacterium]